MNDTQPRPDDRESGPDFLILASLSDGPRHVYAMIEDIDRLAGVRLDPDALHGAISRLAQRGLVEPFATHDLQQPYWLTNAGAEVARARFTQLADLANTWSYRGCRSFLRTRLQPGEQLQDPVRGSYEGSPICRPTAAGND
jgi:DNA-binding PadR family transcriptional regulator